MLGVGGGGAGEEREKEKEERLTHPVSVLLSFLSFLFSTSPPSL